MNLFSKFRACLLTIAVAAAASPAFAQAVQDMGGVFEKLNTQATPLGDLIGSASFIFGAGIAIFGLLKARAHSQNPNDPSNKLSSAMMLIMVGAAMVAIPTLLGVGVGTLFGSGSDTSSIGGTFQGLQ